MSHNVHFDAQYPALPILTVKPPLGGRAATILFSETSRCVTLHPWTADGTPAVRIDGEDLYAFRELLNELPEDAFVRPADPEPESYYVVDKQGHGYVYLPDWDGWRNLTLFVSGGHEPPSHGPLYGGFEDGLAKLIRDRGVDARETKPRWSFGDIVEYPSSTKGHRVTYIRGTNDWTRVAMSGGTSCSTGGDSTDDQINRTVDREGYNVVRQANA